MLKYDKVADEIEEDEIRLVTLYEEPIKPTEVQQPIKQEEPEAENASLIEKGRESIISE